MGKIIFKNVIIENGYTNCYLEAKTNEISGEVVIEREVRVVALDDGTVSITPTMSSQLKKEEVYCDSRSKQYTRT